MYFHRPARSATKGAWDPSAAYSIATGAARAAPRPCGTKVSPVVHGSIPPKPTPARSHSVAHRSIVETGASTRPGSMPGAAIIKGTRAEPSRKDILYHSPRSPSMSPWSDTNTTTASCRVSSITFSTCPIFSSM